MVAEDDEVAGLKAGGAESSVDRQLEPVILQRRLRRGRSGIGYMRRWSCDLLSAGCPKTVNSSIAAIGDAAIMRTGIWSCWKRQPTKPTLLAHPSGDHPINRMTRLDILGICTVWAGALQLSFEAGRVVYGRLFSLPAVQEDGGDFPYGGRARSIERLSGLDRYRSPPPVRQYSH